MTTGFLAVYSLVAMAIGGQFVVGHHGALVFVYFALAGVVWLPVVMAIIRWMSKSDHVLDDASGNVKLAKTIQQSEGKS